MRELNHQPPEKLDESVKLQVNQVWRTMQGEGPWQGTPAVFVRLAGCNLQCPLCDTEYTLRSECTPGEVVGMVNKARNLYTKLVVITGGEPFRQMALCELVEALLKDHFIVQIETNGTVFRSLGYDRTNLWTVVSPKNGKVNNNWCSLRDNERVCWKYVLHADHISLADGLPLSALGMSSLPSRPPAIPSSRIYVQPVDVGDDEENKRHTAAALKSSMDFGYRLNLQLHKLVGMK